MDRPASLASTVESRVEEPAIVADRVTVAYGPTVILDELDLRVPAGIAVALIGENGSGKSSLLRCAAGLQQPTAGAIRVFAQPPGGGVEFWRNVATTVEAPAWYHGLTVREHLELVRVANERDPADECIDEVCEALGIAFLGGSLPSTLSSGQRQRFLLAAVLVRPSRLLLLDEPEQRLDAPSRTAVAALLRDYVAAGGTVLMASHDTEFLDQVGCRTIRLSRSDR